MRITTLDHNTSDILVDIIDAKTSNRCNNTIY